MLLACADSENGWINTDQVRFVKPVSLDSEASRWMLAAFCQGDPNPVPLFYGRHEDMAKGIYAYAEAIRGGYLVTSIAHLVDEAKKADARREQRREMEESERKAEIEKAMKPTPASAWLVVLFAVVSVVAVVAILLRRHTQFQMPDLLSPALKSAVTPWTPFLVFYAQIGATIALVRATIMRLGEQVIGSHLGGRSTAFVICYWPVAVAEAVIDGFASLIPFSRR